MPQIADPTGLPVEIAKGRGDLRYTSVPFAGGQAEYAKGTALVGGRVVSFAKIFATQPWVAAAVMRLLTWSARVPLKVYERTGENDRRRLGPLEHPLAASVITPWPRGSQAQLVQALLGPMLVHGTSLTQLEQGAKNRIRFIPADWRAVTPIEPTFNEIAGWKVNEAVDERVITFDTALQVSYWSPIGAMGISPLQQLGTTLAIEDAAQRYQKAMLANSARPPSAIQTSKEFLGLDVKKQDEMLANLREDVTSIYGGPDNAGTPALLPPGLEWEIVGHTAVEAELIDQRKVAREEVAAVYMIPPPMIGILDKATYSNIAVQRQMAYTDSLGPPLVMAEQAINAILVEGLLREPEIYVEFDFAGVLRGDLVKEIEALRAAIGIGLMTPNEGRTVLNRPPSDQAGANELWMPTNNLAPIGSVAVGDDTEEASPGDVLDDKGAGGAS
jgi:HK97 family phage portal protein